MSFRNFAQAFLDEKRAQRTKPLAIQETLDLNENELQSKISLSNSQSKRSKKVVTHLRKIKAYRVVEKIGDQIYVTQRVIARPPSETSTDSETNEDVEVDVESNNKKLPADLSLEGKNIPFGTQRSSLAGLPGPLTNLETLDMPVEFRGESKSSLIAIVYQLRRTVEIQHAKIFNLETCIDERLAIIMDKNPLALEIKQSDYL